MPLLGPYYREALRFVTVRMLAGGKRERISNLGVIDRRRWRPLGAGAVTFCNVTIYVTRLENGGYGYLRRSHSFFVIPLSFKRLLFIVSRVLQVLENFGD